MRRGRPRLPDDERKAKVLLMNPYEQKLVDFIRQNSIQVEHLAFSQSCHSVEEAAQAANARPEQFVKNVCVINETNGEFIVAIIPGDKRLDLKKLAALVGSKKLRFAKAEEMLEKTGYPMGGTPSFGYSAKFFMDKAILNKEMVYSGGGSPNALTKVSPQELVRVNGATEADLVKE